MNPFNDDGTVAWDATAEAGNWGRWPRLDEGYFFGTNLPIFSADIVTRRDQDGAEVSRLSLESCYADGGCPTGHDLGVSKDNWIFSSSGYPYPVSDATRDTLSAWNESLEQVWSILSPGLSFSPIVSESGKHVLTIGEDCRVRLIDRYTGQLLASHQMLGNARRHIPVTKNGVAYVAVEFPPPERVDPRDLHGRQRPNGEIIDVADYACFAERLIGTPLCPPIYAHSTEQSASVHVLYAFPFE